MLGLWTIGIGGWNLIGDFALSRDVLDGQITATAHAYGAAGRDNYRIAIDGRHFNATAEVYARVHSGDRVRAELGAASQTVLRVTPQ
jgi:hypothetical protein